MKMAKLALGSALGSILLSSMAFAQSATSQYFSPYYPLVSDPYVSGVITLIRDITIIIVLWMFFFKYFGDKK